MKQTSSVIYPVAPAVLMRAFSDRRFHEDKIRALGALHCEVLAFAVVDDMAHIHIRRQMRNQAAVPAVLRKLIPEVSIIEHEDRWNLKTQSGQIALQIEGLPVKLRCEIAAVARGEQTELLHHWDIRCALPIVGGAIERFIAGDLPQRMDEEANASRPLIERYR